MSLEIVDAELDDLAREVAEATGESVADAVKGSLRERLERVKPAVPAPARREVSEEERQRRLAAIREFRDYVRSLPVLDARTPDEIIGYDENGLPS